MILKRKLYTNAEGKHTKEVRKKTDKGDIALSTLGGALSGGLIGGVLGKPVQGAIIGGTLQGSHQALKAAGRRRNNKTGKNPHKPDEIKYNTEPGTAGKVIMVSSAALGTAGLTQGSSRKHAAKIANEILEGKSKRMKKANPEDIQKFREYVAAKRAVYGKEVGNRKVIDEIAKTFNIPVLARIPIQEETSRAVDAGDVDSLDIPEIAGAAQVIEKLL